MRSPLMLFIASSLALAATLALASPARADDWGNDKKDDDTEDTEQAPKKKAPPTTTVEPPSEEWDITDVEEKPGKAYFFVGLRYRGNLVPAFMLHIFLDEGKSVYTNMIAAEFEYRKDGFSLIPALAYHELGTGDILFREKNAPDIAGNYGLVNSGLKVMYAQLDVLWSARISKNVEFEYGAGFGVGAVFGTLQNSWVERDDANGTLANDAGQRYKRCETVGAPGTGCNKADHQNSSVDKVGGYEERSWFNGGAKPSIFPWISLPQIGLRIKPIKNFVGRVGLGFSLTGFWFGLEGQYGLEQKPKP
ncbi:MAG: hypothetical protein KIT84_42300 [Labilithrix sp.]|nr:hypothetical protein [Labilithrix sp.]MCW5817708.1 hypothetical protein [Labilithrix sp.]